MLPASAPPADSDADDDDAAHPAAAPPAAPLPYGSAADDSALGPQFLFEWEPPAPPVPDAVQLRQRLRALMSHAPGPSDGWWTAFELSSALPKDIEKVRVALGQMLEEAEQPAAEQPVLERLAARYRLAPAPP
jgi:hypothetical protein